MAEVERYVEHKNLTITLVLDEHVEFVRREGWRLEAWHEDTSVAFHSEWMSKDAGMRAFEFIQALIEW